ncbi:hypothetical protein, conserved [Leishmania tarentolae]|uniref:Uncharacterized protein n=1 Tax=Leishmania tarentolae TaxID=5689 RepID=A0A640KPZ9_LEITA|nr:hypothetical protein, conserved [Leishmania tarentolae]
MKEQRVVQSKHACLSAAPALAKLPKSRRGRGTCAAELHALLLRQSTAANSLDRRIAGSTEAQCVVDHLQMCHMQWGILLDHELSSKLDANDGKQVPAVLALPLHTLVVSEHLPKGGVMRLRKVHELAKPQYATTAKVCHGVYALKADAGPVRPLRAVRRHRLPCRHPELLEEVHVATIVLVKRSRPLHVQRAQRHVRSDHLRKEVVLYLQRSNGVGGLLLLLRLHQLTPRSRQVALLDVVQHGDRDSQTVRIRRRQLFGGGGCRGPENTKTSSWRHWGLGRATQERHKLARRLAPAMTYRLKRLDDSLSRLLNSALRPEGTSAASATTRVSSRHHRKKYADAECCSRCHRSGDDLWRARRRSR